MIAEWLSGRCWSEKAICKAVGWNGSFRPSVVQQKMTTAFIRRLGGHAEWPFAWRAGDGRDLGTEGALRNVLGMERGESTVAMLLVSSYRSTARMAHTTQIPVNLGHWEVVRSIRKVSPDLDSEARAKPLKKGHAIDLAVVHDPSCSEPRFEPWESIAAQIIDSALVVTKKAPRRRARPAADRGTRG
jgi:hypothetical protein